MLRERIGKVLVVVIIMVDSDGNDYYIIHYEVQIFCLDFVKKEKLIDFEDIGRYY